jgi:hypothetical protein
MGFIRSPTGEFGWLERASLGWNEDRSSWELQAMREIPTPLLMNTYLAGASILANLTASSLAQDDNPRSDVFCG